MKIDKDTYKIPQKNFYKTKHKKKQIILAGSLRKDNLHIKRLSRKEYGNTKKWCTFSISREGAIYQHYDPRFYTDFMGIKTVDKQSISIVLENMGSVYYDNDTWVNWALEECPENRVFEKNWKGCRYWEAYTENQFNSVVKLCLYLCDKYNIVLDSFGHNVSQENTKTFEGIVTRSNFDSEYEDLNPSFDFKRLLNELGIEYE